MGYTVIDMNINRFEDFLNSKKWYYERNNYFVNGYLQKRTDNIYYIKVGFWKSLKIGVKKFYLVKEQCSYKDIYLKLIAELRFGKYTDVTDKVSYNYLKNLHECLESIYENEIKIKKELERQEILKNLDEYEERKRLKKQKKLENKNEFEKKLKDFGLF